MRYIKVYSACATSALVWLLWLFVPITDTVKISILVADPIIDYPYTSILFINIEKLINFGKTSMSLKTDSLQVRIKKLDSSLGHTKLITVHHYFTN